MKRYRQHRHVARAVLLLGAGLVVGGCASLNVNTNMTSMVDPEWQPEAAPERVLVFAATTDIEARRSIEDRFGQRATMFVPSYALFFPGREYTDAKVQGILDEHAIDAVLILEGGEDGVNTATWGKLDAVERMGELHGLRQHDELLRHRDHDRRPDLHVHKTVGDIQCEALRPTDRADGLGRDRRSQGQCVRDHGPDALTRRGTHHRATREGRRDPLVAVPP